MNFFFVSPFRTLLDQDLLRLKNGVKILPTKNFDVKFLSVFLPFDIFIWRLTSISHFSAFTRCSKINFFLEKILFMLTTIHFKFYLLTSCIYLIKVPLMRLCYMHWIRTWEGPLESSRANHHRPVGWPPRSLNRRHKRRLVAEKWTAR